MADGIDYTHFTPEKQAKFLKVLSEGGSVTKAAAAVKIVRLTAYNLRENNPEFAAAWDAAIEAGTDLLEDEAHRRAFKGVRKPIYQGGKLAGHVTEYSDTLTIFLLKGRRPEKYRDNIRFDVDKEIATLLAALAVGSEAQTP